MKRSVLLSLSLFLVCLGLSGNSARSDEPIPVRTVSPRKVSLKRETTQPGTVHAFYEARLYSRVTGYLTELHVDIGDTVEAGQALGQVDVPEMVKTGERLEAEVASQEAEEERYRAEVAVAIAEVASSVATLEQAGANVKKARAQLLADRSEFERVSELVKTGTLNDKLLDEARNRFEAAEAAEVAAEAVSTAMAAAVEVTRAREIAAHAEVKAALARTTIARKKLEEVEVLIGYATLRAPFRGTISERNVDPGDLVREERGAGRDDGRPLFSVVQFDTVRVRVALPERDAPWVDVGDPAAIKIDALPGKSIQGKVSRMSRSLDVHTRTMMVEIDLPNPTHQLLPGMFGRVTVSLETHTDSLTLPAGSVHFGEKSSGAWVCVVGNDGKVQHVAVTVGLDDGQQIEILTGLSGDEKVVRRMLGRLLPGQEVRLIE